VPLPIPGGSPRALTWRGPPLPLVVSMRKRTRHDAGVTAREKYDAMLREAIGPWLRERGFRKRRSRFRREDGQGWQVVDFQASQWGSRDDVRFTINLWIGVKELHAADADAQVRQRVGALLPGGEDHWWSLDDATDTGALASELREVLDGRCLPWLDARCSLDRLMVLARESPDEFPQHALTRFQMLLERAGLDDLASEVRT
jgi:uncharacterized protein DUF4304